MTFSSAVMAGSSWKDWNTKPTVRARNAARPSSSSAKRSRPAMRTRPALGVSSPASNPSNVDFPEPDTPTMATASRGATSKLTSARMVNTEPSVGTVLPSSSTRTIAPVDSSSADSMFMLARILCVLALAVAPGLAGAATILVFGDSLSSGYGIAQDSGWTRLLEKRLAGEGYKYGVANASISGETTSGGTSRIAGALETHRPAIVVIELGANDGLRGQSLET